MHRHSHIQFYGNCAEKETQILCVRHVRCALIPLTLTNQWFEWRKQKRNVKQTSWRKRFADKNNSKENSFRIFSATSLNDAMHTLTYPHFVSSPSSVGACCDIKSNVEFSHRWVPTTNDFDSLLRLTASIGNVVTSEIIIIPNSHLPSHRVAGPYGHSSLGTNIVLNTCAHGMTIELYCFDEKLGEWRSPLSGREKMHIGDVEQAAEDDIIYRWLVECSHCAVSAPSNVWHPCRCNRISFFHFFSFSVVHSFVFANFIYRFVICFNVIPLSESGLERVEKKVSNERRESRRRQQHCCHNDGDNDVWSGRASFSNTRQRQQKQWPNGVRKRMKNVSGDDAEKPKCRTWDTPPESKGNKLTQSPEHEHMSIEHMTLDFNERICVWVCLSICCTIGSMSPTTVFVHFFGRENVRNTKINCEPIGMRWPLADDADSWCRHQ